MTIRLNEIRRCLEGSVPGTMATCALDGIVNVAYLSHAHYIDEHHVALSFQFFNTTRKNILSNPRAVLQVTDPATGVHYRLQLMYLHTESEGPLFELMKARLAGIASHSGMSKVFKLLGSDVYRVLNIQCAAGARSHRRADAGSGALSALRVCIRRLAACGDLDCLIDEALAILDSEFDMRHTMFLMLDANGEKLYTVASRGYPESGAGSEIALGEGIIGVAARECIPVRINHMAQEYLYSRAVRASFMRSAAAQELETEIALPGLAESRSQLAVPVAHDQRLLGMIYLESEQDMRFGWEEEDALVALADYFALSMVALDRSAEMTEHGAPHRKAPTSAKTRKDSAPESSTPIDSNPMEIRFYPADQSVFVDNEYLIKGVAGAIIWKLLRDYARAGRQTFTNRELRLDPSLGLPDIVNNLEARLILLQRRLQDRCAWLAIEKIARGRFCLHVKREIRLVCADGGLLQA